MSQTPLRRSQRLQNMKGPKLGNNFIHLFSNNWFEERRYKQKQNTMKQDEDVIYPSISRSARTLKCVRNNPNVFIIDNFLTDKEINHLLEISHNNSSKFETSYTQATASDQIYSKERTSTFIFLAKYMDRITRSVENRAADIVSIPVCNVEQLQIVRYTDGQEFTLHHDAGTLINETKKESSSSSLWSVTSNSSQSSSYSSNSSYSYSRDSNNASPTTPPNNASKGDHVNVQNNTHPLNVKGAPQKQQQSNLCTSQQYAQYYAAQYHHQQQQAYMASMYQQYLQYQARNRHNHTNTKSQSQPLTQSQSQPQSQKRLQSQSQSQSQIIDLTMSEDDEISPELSLDEDNDVELQDIEDEDDDEQLRNYVHKQLNESRKKNIKEAENVDDNDSNDEDEDDDDDENSDDNGDNDKDDDKEEKEDQEWREKNAKYSVEMVPPYRICSFFVYLTTLPEGAGGETYFPKIGLKVRPERGKAILWCNVDPNNSQKPDPMLIHRACAVNGDYEKIGMNIWINDTSISTAR